MHQEDAFNLTVRRLLRSSQVYYVLGIAYSAFGFIRGNPDMLLLLRNSTKDIVSYYGGVLFDMSQGDQFVVFPDTMSAKVSEIADRVTAAAFPDLDISEGEDDVFVRIYKIPEQYVELRHSINDYQERATNTGNSVSVISKTEKETSLADLDGPLTVWSLYRIEKLFPELDFTNFIKTQSIYKTDFNGNWHHLFTENYVSINDMRQAWFPKLQINGSDRLFYELCHALDRRSVPEIIRRHRSSLNGRISFNISLETLTGPTFEKFLHDASPEERQSIILEINRADFLQHPRETIKAMSRAREAGFGVALDGVTLDILPFTNIYRIEVDYVKINMVKSHLWLLKDNDCLTSLRKIPKEKIILCRCDLEQSVPVGQAFGLTHFQGWLIDRLAQGGLAASA